jgi:hypothetical protein
MTKSVEKGGKAEGNDDCAGSAKTRVWSGVGNASIPGRGADASDGSTADYVPVVRRDRPSVRLLGARVVTVRRDGCDLSHWPAADRSLTTTMEAVHKAVFCGLFAVA